MISKIHILPLLLLLPLAVQAKAAVDLKRLKVAQGYEISYFHEDVPNARSMTVGDKGTVFVGTRTKDLVYALVDTNKDGKADKKYLIAKGLDSPNGVAFKDGALYVAEISRILRFDKIEESLAKPPKPVVVYDKLPKEEHHGWKFIAFGPDGFLYVPVGAPCNNCESKDPRFASILRFKKLDGSDPEIFASGVRNTVGFTWLPNGEMWFTDNGRDWMGEDLPPCELNRAEKPGLHYGYPYCHAGDLKDPEFGSKRACKEFRGPELKMAAHVAPLGIRYRDSDLIWAEHGSWNREKPQGYRVMRTRMKKNRATTYEPLVEGWLQPNEVLGRPVDVQPLRDGSFLISDDHAGAVYRVAPILTR
jgi:glucose/arabinose dehydrogenase